MSQPVVGEVLLEACSRARERLVLCAPFVKRGVLDRALEQVDDAVTIELFTRWRPEEVAAGVSDTAVLEAIEARGGVVRLCDRLHAKYVWADRRVWLGSANLTAKALGWARRPNLELLIEVPEASEEVAALERVLRSESVEATTELAAEVERAAAMLVGAVRTDRDEATEPAEPWLPRLREPRDLHLAYSVGVERLSSTSASAALTDLQALELPPGLDRPAFEAVVGTRLLQTPIVREVDHLLARSQRFGAVRELIQRRTGLSRDEASHVWQTMMRWLLHFAPTRYERTVPNRSEVLRRMEESR